MPRISLYRPYWDDMVWLSIKEKQRALKDWRDFMEIKNQLVGEEHEAVELYPLRMEKNNTIYGVLKIQVFPIWICQWLSNG